MSAVNPLDEDWLARYYAGMNLERIYIVANTTKPGALQTLADLKVWCQGHDIDAVTVSEDVSPSQNDEVISRFVSVPLFFTKNDGRPYGDFKKSFFTALKKSDIKEFRFHDLRHDNIVIAGVAISR